MKRSIRWSRCSGSTKRLIEKILARGYVPDSGMRLKDFYPARNRRAGGGKRE